jgi:O-antigen/teichoic acid export membrane protein
MIILLSFVKDTMRDVVEVAASKQRIREFFRVPLYRNALYILLTAAGSSIVGFLFWMVAARYYSSSEVGLASALIAAMALVNALSLLGLDTGLIRFLSGEEDKTGMINSCFTIVGVCSIALAAIFIVGLPLWSPALLFLREDANFLLPFIAFATLTSLFGIQRQAFVALRSAKFAFAQEMVWQSSRMALVIVLISLGVLGLLYSWGIAACLGLIIANLFLLRKVQPNYLPLPVIKKRIVNDMMHFSLGNYGAEVMSIASICLLPLMVVNILGAESSAYFRIAWGIAAMLFAVPIAVTMSLLAEGSNEPEKLRGNVIKATKLMFVLLLSAIMLILLFGDKILLLFGSEYSENALKMLWILSLSSIPLAINELYVDVKRVELKMKPIIYVYSSMAILVLGACYILMGKLGLIGVAIGWTLGNGAVALVVGPLMIRWVKEGGGR